MCRGTECPTKNSCYRHTAPVNPEWQSYFTEEPYDKEKQECEYYWDNKNRQNEKTKK
jgi:hypothetical protein